ncbi:MAG: hypothetical protein JKY65_10520 [Planctomycetes bacterium]|nr:hypothetical protein [Planctomycetota bacterium]
MSRASPADKKKAKKRRRTRHKRRMKAAKGRRRAERDRQRRHKLEPEVDPWPDTTGLSEEEAAKVWEELFFWEDYFERNPDSKCGPPLSDLTVSTLRV